MSLYSTLMTYLHDIITEIAQIRQHQEYVLVVIVRSHVPFFYVKTIDTLVIVLEFARDIFQMAFMY